MHIIVIGKEVGKNLRFELRELGVPITVVRQPQGDRRSSEKQLEKYMHACMQGEAWVIKKT